MKWFTNSGRFVLVQSATRLAFRVSRRLQYQSCWLRCLELEYRLIRSRLPRTHDSVDLNSLRACSSWHVPCQIWYNKVGSKRTAISSPRVSGMVEGEPMCNDSPSFFRCGCRTCWEPSLEGLIMKLKQFFCALIIALFSSSGINI